MGRQFISILLGIGLAAMFRSSCTDKKCITFKGPVISEVDGKTYQFGDSECSKFKLVPVQRDPAKKVIPLKSKPEMLNGIAVQEDDEEKEKESDDVEGMQPNNSNKPIIIAYGKEIGSPYQSQYN